MLIIYDGSLIHLLRWWIAVADIIIYAKSVANFYIDTNPALRCGISCSCDFIYAGRVDNLDTVTNRNASKGQILTQKPQSVQLFSMQDNFSSKSNASDRQTLIQVPHPSHFIWSIIIIETAFS